MVEPIKEKPEEVVVKEEPKGPEKIEVKKHGSGIPPILKREEKVTKTEPAVVKPVSDPEINLVKEDLRNTQEDIGLLQQKVKDLEEGVADIDANYLPAKYFGYGIPIVAMLAFGLLWLFGYPVAYGAVTIVLGCIVLGILAYGYRHGWFQKPKRPGT